jgi:hypothetical protein
MHGTTTTKIPLKCTPNAARRNVILTEILGKEFGRMGDRGLAQNGVRVTTFVTDTENFGFFLEECYLFLR